MGSPDERRPADTTRVRFAPSPTGHLHVGGARTAIYNWLFARHTGGRFVLRIDDTDPERSSPEFTDAILRGMRWLGLDWDEGPEAGGDYGPYFQSERAGRYDEAAGRLLDAGTAYKCYCTPEELARKRDEAIAAKRPPGYDRACRDLSVEERSALELKGIPHVIRFAVPREGQTGFTDAIRGALSVENAHVEDFVVVRSDGTPTYNFASTLDDADMRITHVIRGDDHLSNTPKQILILTALGEPVPIFAHLPMIWGQDKTRLSKRHGATSIESYRDQGYLPDALVNFLSLLGWSPGSEETLFARDDLVRLFTLDRVASSAAIFDHAKLDWMNGQYMRALSAAEFIDRARPFLEAAGLDISQPRPPGWWDSLAEITNERIERFDQLPDLVRFLFGEVGVDPAAAAKALASEDCPKWLDSVATALAGIDPFGSAPIEAAMRAMPEELGVKPKPLFQAVRAAVTGTLVSPPLFESIALLGKADTIRRLSAAARTACETG
jgi:glutamyl-tRNA synthetase